MVYFCNQKNEYMTQILSIDQLCLWRGDRWVLEDFSLEQPRGSVCFIQGKNGSGKSSLLRAICGLLPYDSGHIQLHTQHICFLDHHYFFYRDLTIKENIALWANIKSLNMEAILQSAASFGLPLSSFPHHLSQGQMRKCLLCFIAQEKADFYLLDEPYSFLDDDGKMALDHIISEKYTAGASLLITSHEKKRIPLSIYKHSIRERHKMTSIIHMELLQLWRRKQDWCFYGFFFFALPFLLYFALGKYTGTQHAIGLYFAWVALIFTHILSCQNQLSAHFQNGYFEQILLSPYSLSLYLLIRIIGLWLAKTCLFLFILPLFYLFFSIEITTYIYAMIIFSLTLLYFEAIGHIGSILTEQVRQASALFMLITLPFYLPAFLFGLMALQAMETGVTIWPFIAMLGGLDLLLCAIIPYISTQMIKMRLSQ